MLMNLLAQGIPWEIIIPLVLLVIVITFVVVIAQFFGLWLQAFMSKADVSFADLIDAPSEGRLAFHCAEQDPRGEVGARHLDERPGDALPGGRACRTSFQH